MAVSVFTTEQYETLCAMLAKGVTSMEVAGEKVTFRSLPEMMRLKSAMEADLGLTTRAKTVYPSFVKG